MGRAHRRGNRGASRVRAGETARRTANPARRIAARVRRFFLVGLGAVRRSCSRGVHPVDQRVHDPVADPGDAARLSGAHRSTGIRWVADREISPLASPCGGRRRGPEVPDPPRLRPRRDRSAWEERRGGRARGASTISQQVAKNLFLWSGRSWLRKGLEAWFTVWIEALWPKRRILEIYLNFAEMGRASSASGAPAGATSASAARLDRARRRCSRPCSRTRAGCTSTRRAPTCAAAPTASCAPRAGSAGRPTCPPAHASSSG